MSTLLKEARILANYIKSLSYDDFIYVPGTSYNHIGALFVDIVLQSGLNYSTVVRPRVARVLKQFPQSVTISLLEKAIADFGVKYVLNWQNNEKISRLLALIEFAKENNIETEEDFRKFLLVKANIEKFISVKGIGPKTVDYTLKLLAIDSIAVDRHIFNFVNKAGITRRNYYEVRTIVEYAADLLQSPRRKLDTFIWLNMSKSAISRQLDFSELSA
jgi:thermostable 8-oxoguanine DNA glycosylase